MRSAVISRLFALSNQSVKHSATIKRVSNIVPVSLIALSFSTNSNSSQSTDQSMSAPNSEDYYKSKLTTQQHAVARGSGTERPFTGQWLNNKQDGVYTCVCCDTPVFDSKTKFDSGSGWPSYWDKLPAVAEKTDDSHGMRRVEVVCSNCQAHLGHVFNDGPKETTGMRYCINSASLDFKPRSSQ